MTDYNDDEANIDDLIDYNDFDSRDLNSKDEDDLFDDDIEKYYEDHKRNVHAKANEANNAQRPISSYQRVVASDRKDTEGNNTNNNYNSPSSTNNNKYTDDFNCFKEIQEEESKKYSTHKKEDEIVDDYINHNQSNENYEQAFNDPYLENENYDQNFLNEYALEDYGEIENINKSNFNVEYSISEYERISGRLRGFVKKIIQNEFCDNENLFLNFDDFSAIFRKIRFEIKASDIKILFCHENPHKNEGYILIKQFINSCKLDFKDINLENATDEYDMKKVNEKFNHLHNEILEIVRKDLYDNKKGLMSERDSLRSGNKRLVSATTAISGLTKPSSALKSLRPVTGAKTYLMTNESKITASESSFRKNKMDVSELLELKLKKMKDQEKLLKLNYLKRRKEFEDDCIKKIFEANKMCQELNIAKNFTQISDKVCIN